MSQPLDRTEFEQLYLRLEKPMYNVVLRYIWNETEAQDIVQDAFVKVISKSTHIERSSVEAYLYRTAINMALNRLRWNKVKRVFASSSNEFKNPESLVIQQQELNNMQEQLQILPEKYKQVLLLSEIAELSYADIAQTLQISQGTVGSRRSRGLKMLKTKLNEKRGSHEPTV